jgi:nicotinate dehydrogenase subunit B
MTTLMAGNVSRRAMLTGGGALVLGFSLVPRRLLAQGSQNAGAPPTAELPLPGSLNSDPMLHSWIRVGADGTVTVFTGKAELGQGVKTAFIQLAAEELAVDLAAIRLVTADTARTPNEGYTAGSHSMQDSGTAIMNAAAQVRVILIEAAAARLELPAERLKASGGAVIADDGRRLGYGELVADQMLHVRAEPHSDRLDPKDYRLIGKPLPRVDIPGKVTGGMAYVQDLRLPEMVHARVVWPPSYGAKLRDVDIAPAARLPGVLKIVRDGSYLAIAEGEYQAVVAMRALQTAAVWDETPRLPDQSDIFAYLERQPAQQIPVRSERNGALPPARHHRCPR